MDTIDYNTVLRDLFEAMAPIFIGLIAYYGNRLMNYLEQQNILHLTDQQIASMRSAAVTAAGIIETQIDQKLLSPSSVTVNNPAVLKEANNAIRAVPDSAAALKMTPEAVARIIVGLADTSPPAVSVVLPTVTGSTNPRPIGS